jgi:transaldolase
MNDGYFHRVTRETPTRFWINNPTLDDADRAIAAGASSCTTNPTFCAQMLRSESESAYALKVIDRVIQDKSDDRGAAELVMLDLVKRVMVKFLPLYEREPGGQGLVSIQGDPHGDEDPDFIVEEALRFRKLEKNFITKIPVTHAGLRAMEVLVAENMPIIATEVFAIEQAVEACELYLRVSKETGNRPPFYVTHITGIFDEYLANCVQREGIEISPEALKQAGCAVARKQYQILRERRYPVIMLGGGARRTHHFTEMVGGAVHITINWSTAQELLEANPPVVPRMNAVVPETVINELIDKLPDFRKAYADHGLCTEEFAGYGPLQYFRGMFVKGWDTLVERIKDRRRESAMAPNVRR